MTLPFSTTSIEMLRVGLDMLLRRAFARPALRNRSLGAATLMSSTTDGEPWKFSIRFRTPVETLGARLRAYERTHRDRAAVSSHR